jgi:hypothetical protein
MVVDVELAPGGGKAATVDDPHEGGQAGEAVHCCPQLFSLAR